MITQTTRRMLALVMTVLLALPMLMPATAEQATVYVAREGAKVYDESGEVVGTLPLNTPLTLTGVKGQVCRVEKDGRTGYMAKGDLSAAPVQTGATPAPTSTPTATATPASTATAHSAAAYVSRDGATVYTETGAVAGTLALNTQVTVTAIKSGVCRIEYNGRTGYMRKGDLSAAPVSASPTPTVTPAPTARSVAAYVVRDGAPVYAASGAMAGTLGQNAQVTVTAVKGGLCRIEYNGRTGYMKKGDLSATPVSATATPAPTATPGAAPQGRTATAYVNKSSAKVYNESGDAIATLNLNDVVTVLAVKGEVCKVTASGYSGYMKRDDLSAQKTTVPAPTAAPTATPRPSGGSTVTPARGTAREMDWWTSDIQTIFARGVVAQITDVETGLSWREKRSGGTNHADCQPLTAEDTAVMKRVYGGTWSWNRRAVFVTINGVNYAASINGMPHGSGSISDNNFNGHHCIHFTNSRTHGSNKVCPLHQAAIRKAASTRL